jgi:hypothetical protein
MTLRVHSTLIVSREGRTQYSSAIAAVGDRPTGRLRIAPSSMLRFGLAHQCILSLDATSTERVCAKVKELGHGASRCSSQPTFHTNSSAHRRQINLSALL